MHHCDKRRTRPLFHWWWMVVQQVLTPIRQRGRKRNLFSKSICCWKLLINYKLYFLEMPFACISVWVCMYLSICLSIHLHIYLHACVCLETDTHSSLPNGQALWQLHPSNKGTGSFIKKYYRRALKSSSPWRISWTHSVSGMSKWSLEICRLINQAGQSYHVYDYTYSPMK